MSDVRDILTDIGYTLTDNGKEYRTRALYRDGDNNSVLRIYKDSGNWKDFKENIAGSLEELVRLTMGLDSIEKAKEYLCEKGFDPLFGARPLRRLIENEVENLFSDKLLSGEINEGDSVVVDIKKGKIILEPKIPALSLLFNALYIVSLPRPSHAGAP